MTTGALISKTSHITVSESYGDNPKPLKGIVWKLRAPVIVQIERNV